MQYNQFPTINYAWYQTIWIEDQAPRVVGPDLDPFCLQRSFKINIILVIVRKYFHFVPEHFEGTVYGAWQFGTVL